MKPKNLFSVKQVHQTLLAILHGFLLMPVLTVFLEINHVNGYRYVLFFLLFSQAVALLCAKWWLFFSIQLGSMIYTLYHLFPPSFSSMRFRDWLYLTLTTGIDQWQNIFSDQTIEFPDLLSMTAVLVLITLLTYLTIRLKQPFLSFLVGLVYLFILHTFTSTMIFPQMIQVVGLGFLLLSFVQMSDEANWKSFLKAITGTSLLTALLMSISYWSVDQFRPAQQWVEVHSHAYQRRLDSNGFFDWIDLNTPGRGFRRTGFGTNDDVLGGPLQTDFTPLFKAYTDRPHYWKVMHREVYTGLGWESQHEQIQTIHSPYSRYSLASGESFSIFLNNEKEGFRTVSHVFEDTPSYVALPYAWQGFQLHTDAEAFDIDMQTDLYTDYHTISTQEEVNGYTVVYESDFPNRLDENLLRHDDGWREEVRKEYSAEDPELDDSSITTNSWMRQAFSGMELPGDLPERVSELAHELTEGMDSEYEMVRAIETYLKEEGGFRYSLRETQETPPGEDYVDYFLFDTKVGYCDNFSSAMTVMLRAVGIPARWAKGFTPGTLQTDADGEEYYQVSNSNAHSWTEVYFPSFGWIPFEPSPSFFQPMTHPEPMGRIGGEMYSFDDSDVLDVTNEEQEEEQANEEQEEQEEEQAEENDISEEEEEAGAFSADHSDDQPLPPLPIISIFLVMLGLLLFIFRYNLLIFGAKMLIQKDKLSLNQACSFVLWIYGKNFSIKEGQTIRSYFNQLKAFVPTYEEQFEQFADLTNEAFYAPKDVQNQITFKQESVILEVLHAFLEMPKASKNKPKKKLRPIRER